MDEGPDHNEHDQNFRQQLHAVEQTARQLGQYFLPDEDGRKDNQYLPEDFPIDQIEDVAAAMQRISRSLPQKLEISMVHAKGRLETIRNNHIPHNRDLAYGRGSYIDELIGRLILELSTALEFFERHRDLKVIDAPEDDRPLDEAERAEADDFIAQSQSLSDALNISIAEAEKLLDSLEQEEIRTFLQSLDSTDILNRLSRAELRHDPRPKWVEGLSDSLKDMPVLIESAADAVDGAADLGQSLWDVIKDPGQAIVNGTRNLASGMRRFARNLRGEIGETGVSTDVPEFDIEKIKHDLIKGIPPHPAHIEQIVELEFRDEADLYDLSAFSSLENLQFLGLDYTSVTSIVPLSNLKNLRTLYLGGTPISDFTPLSNLKNLESLALSSSSITDITPLSNLKNLQFLSLIFTPIKDLSPLVDLPKLKELYLDRLQLDDPRQLSSLRSVEELSLSDVNIPHIELLTDLPKLKRIWLREGQFRKRDVAKILPNVEVIWD